MLHKEEMSSWYGIQMALETTWGNDTKNMCSHFQKIKRTEGAIPKRGCDRFEALRRALCPSNEDILEICSFLEENWMNHVSQVSKCLSDVDLSYSIVKLGPVVVDETVVRYQPGHEAKSKANKKGAPIPVVHIPRKPNPNGLLLYQATTMVLHPLYDK